MFFQGKISFKNICNKNSYFMKKDFIISKHLISKNLHAGLSNYLHNKLIKVSKLDMDTKLNFSPLKTKKI